MIQEKFSKKPAAHMIARHTVAGRNMKSRARRGQALIEMSLVVIVLLFLTLGLIQYGLIANARTTMTNLAREGARYASVHALDSDNINPVSPNTNPDDKIRRYVDERVAEFTALKDISMTDIAVSYPNGRTSGQEVNITINYNLRRKFILPSGFPGLSRFGSNSTATAVMVIE